MPNPVLNDRAFQQAAQSDTSAGWAAPSAGTVYVPPISDGPISAHRPGVMTVGGTISATAAMFAILLVTATVGWNAVKVTGNVVNFPRSADRA